MSNSSSLTHRNSRAQGNHSLYQSNLLADNTKLLTDIKTNTSNLNLNTDTLEAKIGTDTATPALSLTALTRVQKDVLDTKLTSIQNFLDKDHAQFHLKHHPDDHHVMLAGNTSADGTGTKNHAHVDGNGVLKVTQVSTQNIDPANTSNADHASHSKSLAVGLRGRTTITDETSGKFLLCDSDGHLQVDVLNSNITSGQSAKGVGEGLQQVLIYGRKDDGTLQPLECLGDRLLVDVVELSASGKITTSTALSSIQVCGFDDTTSKFKTLKCNSDGELVSNPYTKTADSTHASVAVSIASNGVDGQITLGDTDNYVRYSVDGGASGPTHLYVEGSNDNSNFIRLGQLVVADVNGSNHGSLLVENPPKYLRIKNYDLSSAVVKIQAIYGKK